MNINKAIKEWKEILQDNLIINLNKKVNDVGCFIDRLVPAILFPSSIEEVIALIKIANKYKAPIHPVSAGRNWGLGSKIPVRDNVSVIFLNKLDKIIEVNEKFQYVIVETGVTQGQLADHLQKYHHSLIINVGGGGRTISIVGNILERGTGVYGIKNMQDILAMEIVMPNGELIRTGLWNTSIGNINHHFVHTYSEGLGPDLRGLFVQSNYGIVTKMVIRLRRFNNPLIVNIMTDHLPQLIENLRIFRVKGYLEPGVNIFDFNNEKGAYYRIDNIPKFRWMAVANVFGTDLMRDAAKASIKNYLQISKDFKLEFFDTQEQIFANHNIDNWGKYSEGKVTNDNIKNLYATVKASFKEDFNLDDDFDSNGFVAINAVAPMDGDLILKAVHISDEVASIHNISYGDFGFSDLKEFSLKMHWVFIFNKKDQSEIQLIHKCKNYLLDKLFDIGIFPQRLDVDSMERVYQQNHYGYNELLCKIKNALDENHIISPGRYIK